MAMISRLILVFALANTQHLAQGVFAQDYPNKPIRIITTGGPDNIVRIFGKKFTDAMGQSIVSESMPSAGGKLAAETVAKSRPDGYTLLNAVASQVIFNAIDKSNPDLIKDFAPVALTNTVPYALVVTPALPAKSVQELIALARTTPGKLNYSAVTGTFPHLAFELFKAMARIDMYHIPYKSLDAQFPDIISGRVEAVITPSAGVAGLRQTGKVRILAVTTGQRSRLLPDLPTLAESGLPGYDLVGWNGFLAPPGTPQAVIARLNGLVRQAVKQSDVVQQLETIGYEPGPDFSPEQYGEFLRGETGKWKKIVDDIPGLKVN